MHDHPGHRFDFRRGFANHSSGDPLDFLAERFGRSGEKLSMKLLDLSRPLGTRGENLFRGRQGFVQRDDQSLLAQDDGDRRWRVAGILF